MLENLPPIGVFWDIENCSVPSGRSATAVVQRIREKFFKGHREAEFICVCDISKENKEVIQELNNCQVEKKEKRIFICLSKISTWFFLKNYSWKFVINNVCAKFINKIGKDDFFKHLKSFHHVWFFSKSAYTWLVLS